MTIEGTMNRPRVLLADDHGLLLDAFEKLLEPHCEVVGKVGDGRTLLAAASELEPDVVVLDITMPQLNGLDAGRHLKRTQPDIKLVFLTVHEDPDLAEECMRLGASGYLIKGSAASELFEAIRCAMEGQTYVTPLPTRPTDDFTADAPADTQSGGLTPRQLEVVALLVEGLSMKEAGQRLGVTPRTIAFHKYRVMNEHGLNSSAELIQFAIKRGIVTV
jgi:DNA-binding NarL/FixJ family response regulator